MNSLYESSGAVVLTTHERSGYFTSVLGEDIDLRFDPRNGFMLQNVLHNTLVAGGRLVIIDEAFFMDTDELARGLECFFRHEEQSHRLKLIVVCTHRAAGDFFLAFLVLYCHIYNIIYDKSGVEVSIGLIDLMRRDNTFRDVVHLAEQGCWQEAKKAEARLIEDLRRKEVATLPPRPDFDFEPAHEEVCVSVGDGRLINISFQISGETVLAK